VFVSGEIILLTQDRRLEYHVEMYESTPYVELLFQPTVPLSCQGCTLTVPLSKHVGLTLSRCSLTFNAAEFNSTYTTLRVRAVQTAGRNARIVALKFGRIDADGSPWHGFMMSAIAVWFILRQFWTCFRSMVGEYLCYC